MATEHTHHSDQPAPLSLVWLGFLLLLGILAFGSGFNGVFIFDDDDEIRGNENIQTLWPIWRPMFVPKKLPVRPLPYLSFAINYAVHDYDLWGYHLVNLVIHVATAWIIFSILWQVLTRKQLLSNSSEINRLFALGTAVLWLVHPLQTQPVNYIYQRIELMMSFFFMLTLYCYMWSVWHPQQRIQRLYFVMAWIACASGMLCKEVMLVAPLAVLWFDRVILAGSWQELISKRSKAHLAMIATWIILFLVIYQQSGQYTEYDGNKKLASPLNYLYTESEVICHYIKQIIYPDKLVFDYCWPIKTQLIQVLLPGIFIVSLLMVVVFLIYKLPVLGLVGGWFFLLLGVTSSFNPVLQPACEHRLHLALLGPVILCNLSVYYVSRLFLKTNHTYIKTIFLCYISLIGAVYVGISALRSSVYTNYYVLWQDTANKQPMHALPNYQLGTAYLNSKNYALAESYCKKALLCDPEQGPALNNLGLAVTKQGRAEEGLKAYFQAIKVQPSLPNSYLNVGNFYYNKGHATPENVELAIKYYQQALDHNPQYEAALVNLGIVYAEIKHDYPQAIKYWEQALKINPDNVDAFENRQMLLQSLRK